MKINDKITIQVDKRKIWLSLVKILKGFFMKRL